MMSHRNGPGLVISFWAVRSSACPRSWPTSSASTSRCSACLPLMNPCLWITWVKSLWSFHVTSIDHSIANDLYRLSNHNLSNILIVVIVDSWRTKLESSHLKIVSSKGVSLEKTKTDFRCDVRDRNFCKRHNLIYKTKSIRVKIYTEIIENWKK